MGDTKPRAAIPSRTTFSKCRSSAASTTVDSAELDGFDGAYPRSTRELRIGVSTRLGRAVPLR
jgi:hypothetical protein